MICLISVYLPTTAHWTNIPCLNFAVSPRHPASCDCDQAADLPRLLLDSSAHTKHNSTWDLAAYANDQTQCNLIAIWNAATDTAFISPLAASGCVPNEPRLLARDSLIATDLNLGINICLPTLATPAAM